MSSKDATSEHSTIIEMEKCLVKAIGPDMNFDPDLTYQICRRFSSRVDFPKKVVIDVWKSKSDMYEKEPFISYTVIKNDPSDHITMTSSNCDVKTHIFDSYGAVVRVIFSVLEGEQCPPEWISAVGLYEKFFDKRQPKRRVCFGEYVFDHQSGTLVDEIIFTATIRDCVTVNLVFYNGIVEVYLDDEYDRCTKVSKIEDLVNYLKKIVEGLDQMCENRAE